MTNDEISMLAGKQKESPAVSVNKATNAQVGNKYDNSLNLKTTAENAEKLAFAADILAKAQDELVDWQKNDCLAVEKAATPLVHLGEVENLHVGNTHNNSVKIEESAVSRVVMPIEQGKEDCISSAMLAVQQGDFLFGNPNLSLQVKKLANQQSTQDSGSSTIQAQYVHFEQAEKVRITILNSNHERNNFDQSSNASLDIPKFIADLNDLYSTYNEVVLPFSDSRKKFNLEQSFIRLTLIKERANDTQHLHSSSNNQANWHQKHISSYEDIHKEKSPIEVEALFKINEEDIVINCRKILIFGRAGIGKSTLLRWLAYCSTLNEQQIDKGQNGIDIISKKPVWMSQFAAVFYIPLRRLSEFNLNSTTSPNSLEAVSEFIHFCLQKDNKKDFPTITINTITKILEGKIDKDNDLKTLLLIDGLDEARQWINVNLHEVNPIKIAKQQLLEKLLNLPEIKSYIYTALSTRPMVISDELYRQGKEKCQVLEVMGFDFLAIERFVVKHFSIEKKDMANKRPNISEEGISLLNLIKNQQMLLGVSHIPVVLTFICTIWEKDSKEILKEYEILTAERLLSLTDIYIALVNYLKRRLESKIRKDGTAPHCLEISKTSILSTDHPIIEFLEQLALNGMISGNVILEKDCIIHALEKISNKIPDYTLVETQKVFWNAIKESGFLCFEETDDLIPQPSSVYFFHLSIQEFFAASAIKRSLLENKNIIVNIKEQQSDIGVSSYPFKQFISDYKYKESFEIVWPFVAGLLLRKSHTDSTYSKSVYLHALNVFWKTIHSLPRDLFVINDLALWTRCLNEGYSSDIPNIKAMEQGIQILFDCKILNEDLSFLVSEYGEFTGLSEDNSNYVNKICLETFQQSTSYSWRLLQNILNDIQDNTAQLFNFLNAVHVLIITPVSIIPIIKKAVEHYDEEIKILVIKIMGNFIRQSCEPEIMIQLLCEQIIKSSSGKIKKIITGQLLYTKLGEYSREVILIIFEACSHCLANDTSFKIRRYMCAMLGALSELIPEQVIEVVINAFLDETNEESHKLKITLNELFSRICEKASNQMIAVKLANNKLIKESLDEGSLLILSRIIVKYPNDYYNTQALIILKNIYQDEKVNFVFKVEAAKLLLETQDDIAQDCAIFLDECLSSDILDFDFEFSFSVRQALDMFNDKDEIDEKIDVDFPSNILSDEIDISSQNMEEKLEDSKQYYEQLEDATYDDIISKLDKGPQSSWNGNFELYNLLYKVSIDVLHEIIKNNIVNYNYINLIRKQLIDKYETHTVSFIATKMFNIISSIQSGYSSFENIAEGDKQYIKFLLDILRHFLIRNRKPFIIDNSYFYLINEKGIINKYYFPWLSNKGGFIKLNPYSCLIPILKPLEEMIPNDWVFKKNESEFTSFTFRIKVFSTDFLHLEYAQLLYHKQDYKNALCELDKELSNSNNKNLLLYENRWDPIFCEAALYELISEKKRIKVSTHSLAYYLKICCHLKMNDEDSILEVSKIFKQLKNNLHSSGLEINKYGKLASDYPLVNLAKNKINLARKNYQHSTLAERTELKSSLDKYNNLKHENSELLGIIGIFPNNFNSYNFANEQDIDERTLDSDTQDDKNNLCLLQ